MPFETLILSRYKLQTFVNCRRKFQLTYKDPLSWPLAPKTEKLELAQWRGEQFHLLLERHFRGLPIPKDSIADSHLQAWWQTFQQQPPTLPEGQRLVEYTCTVPIGRHFLTGRFDLLIVGEQTLHIFDWKTEASPRPEFVLRDDLQTWLYLAMAIAGNQAIQPHAPTIQPEHVSLTYWYVNQPDASVTFTYSQSDYERHWAWFESVVADIDDQLSSYEEVWALTEDREKCRHCLFQVYCGRDHVMEPDMDSDPALSPALVLEPPLEI